LNPRPQAFFAQFYMCSRLIGSRLLDRAAARKPGRQSPIFSFPAKWPGKRPAYEVIFAAWTSEETLAQPIGLLLRSSPAI